MMELAIARVSKSFAQRRFTAWALRPSWCPLGVRYTYSLCENTFLAPISIRCFVDLSIGRLRVDDTVLTTNRLAVPLRVVRLLRLEVFKLLLESVLQRVHLVLLEGVVRVPRRILLQEFDLILDLRVPDLCLRDDALKLRR